MHETPAVYGGDNQDSDGGAGVFLAWGSAAARRQNINTWGIEFKILQTLWSWAMWQPARKKSAGFYTCTPPVRR